MAALHGAPVFAPHVTLLGGVEGDEQDVCTTAADLASELVVTHVTLLVLHNVFNTLNSHTRCGWSQQLQAPYFTSASFYDAPAPRP